MTLLEDNVDIGPVPGDGVLDADEAVVKHHTIAEQHNQHAQKQNSAQPHEVPLRSRQKWRSYGNQMTSVAIVNGAVGETQRTRNLRLNAWVLDDAGAGKSETGRSARADLLA
jgi:hypothetical protein